MKFNRGNITEEEKILLADFYTRRKIFETYITEKNLDLTACPGCGYPTFTKDWYQQICSVCNWQHDGQDDPRQDEKWRGPNYISLTENRIDICKKLKLRSIEIGGRINMNSRHVISILKAHEIRMESFDDDENFMNALRTDPIWKEYVAVRNEIMKDLIIK